MSEGKPELTQEMKDWFGQGEADVDAMIRARVVNPEFIIDLWGKRKEVMDNDPREKEARMKYGHSHRRERCVLCGKLTYNSLRLSGAVEKSGLRCYCCADKERDMSCTGCGVIMKIKWPDGKCVQCSFEEESNNENKV